LLTTHAFCRKKLIEVALPLEDTTHISRDVASIANHISQHFEMD